MEVAQMKRRYTMWTGLLIITDFFLLMLSNAFFIFPTLKRLINFREELKWLRQELLQNHIVYLTYDSIESQRV